MKNCANCGAILKDHDTECFNCGSAVEVIVSSEMPTMNDTEKRDYNKDFEAAKAAAKETAGKALAGAQKLAGQLAQKVDEKRIELKAQAEEAAERRKEEEAQRQLEISRAAAAAEQYKQRNAAASNTRYMSSTELWSWLKQNSKRQLFFNETPCDLNEEAFMERVAQKMDEHNVPASIECRDIQWDRSRVHKKTYFIKPMTDVVNPLSYMVQFNHVGSFSFVEEKTFITPPDLPPVPGKPRTVDQSKAGTILCLAAFGALLALVGLISMAAEFFAGLVVMAIGGGLLYWAYSMRKAITDTIEHNKRCAEQEIAWSNAWTNWQNSIFLHSFQEDINGQLSRVYDSAFECIKQVSAEIFKQDKVVMQEESSNLNELEELIARRKEEYR